MAAPTDSAPGPFFDLPPEHCDPARAAALLVPVPYDRTSSWKRGSAAGPEAIREASQQVELYDIETGTEPYRHGIAATAPIDFDGPPEALARRVEEVIGPALDAARLPVVIGGEHSVTIGAVAAAADRVPGLSVLQIDAHADARETHEGSTHNHACVMARARERCPIVQVGIRSLDASERPRLDSERIFFAHDIHRAGGCLWIDRVVQLLDDAVYITIDLDAFDPSVLPATGTPEPGGLDWMQVTGLLERVIARRRVVAFDVVELCPADGHHASAFTAAKLIYRVLAMIFAARPTPS